MPLLLYAKNRPKKEYSFINGVLSTELTHTRASNATLTDATGAVVYADANMLLNSATLETQNVTVVVGNSYTLSGYGTGSVALSGGASGTLTGTGAGNRVSVTFTATTTTATFTVTGSITSAQLNPGATAQPYHPTTTTAYYAPRFDYDPVTHEIMGLLVEPQRTNKVLNSVLTGASAPSTFPTGWAGVTTQGGITEEVIGSGVDTSNNMAYVDIKFSGTARDTSSTARRFSITVAASGEVDTVSMYAKIQAGDLTGISSIGISARQYDGTTGGTTTNQADQKASLSSVPYRMVYTVTCSDAAVTKLNAGYRVLATNGATINLTLRFYSPQGEVGASATSWVPSYSASATRAADAVSFTIPTGMTLLRYTFDDDSTQDVTVEAGAYTIPTTLNRAHIKRIAGYKQ